MNTVHLCVGKIEGEKSKVVLTGYGCRLVVTGKTFGFGRLAEAKPGDVVGVELKDISARNWQIARILGIVEPSGC